MKARPGGGIGWHDVDWALVCGVLGDRAVYVDWEATH